jgi:predicted Zn-dependent protease/Tfp pilus assembly protein PilF
MRHYAPFWLAFSFCLLGVVQMPKALAETGDAMPAAVQPPPGVTREQIEKHNTMARLVHQAYVDIKASRWYSAEEELKQSLALDPKCVEAHLDRVVVLCAMQKYDEAGSEADTVIKLEPHTHRGYMSKAAVFEERGDLKGAVTLIEKVIAQFPQLPDTALYKSKVVLLKKELANEAVAHQKGTSSADDFFDFVTTNGVKKWTPDKFPLKVHMPTDEEASQVTGYKPEFGAALKDAFNTWQTDSSEQVRFQFVDNSADAGIDCQWISDSSKLTNSSEAGEARVKASPLTGIEHADIRLLTVAVGKNAWKTPSATDIKQICLHEIGHALGMSGHSPNPQDIMYPSEELSADARNLTDRDLKTLAHLYQPEVVPSARPGSVEDVASLNAQGVELAKQGDYTGAMQKFETAYKYDPKSQPVKQNMSWCLSKRAADVAQEGDYQAALSFLQRALAMQGDRGDLTMRTNIMHNLVIVYKRLDRPADAQATEDSLQKLTMDKPAKP